MKGVAIEVFAGRCMFRKPQPDQSLGKPRKEDPSAADPMRDSLCPPVRKTTGLSVALRNLTIKRFG
jgi:hypothetical protein